LFITFEGTEQEGNIYETLFKAHKTAMYYTAINILRDTHLAEDAVQQAFERMIKYRAGQKITDPHCNKTRFFLVTIVKHICFDFCNISGFNEIAAVMEDFNPIFSASDPDPLDFILSEERWRHIRIAMNQLAPKYADVLILSRVHEYSDQEIAGMLGITHPNVRIRLHRAKKMLLDILKKEGVSDETR
jgi:RNA polymerase sigma-70 factor (ECF subfamily)